ncbi:MAG TPA: choice-of-anchor P family protein [Gemmatimonadales bacterium]|nr:choice-of-anchor P family protein [Gemmatimonadales bacterium]
MRIHGTHHLAALGVVVALTAGLAVAGTAQTVSGQAFSTYVNTSVASSIQSPLVVLPAVSGTDGAEADAEGAGVTVANTLSSDFLNSITSGELDTSAAGAQSTASAADINVLNGLITADEVIANATSSRTGSGAVSNADGSTFQNLVVAGVALTTGDGPVAPNTTIALSGVGYVVLNEQTLSGDGVTTSGITVNMIHVYLQSALGGPTGEIIVGSATTSVGS